VCFASCEAPGGFFFRPQFSGPAMRNRQDATPSATSSVTPPSNDPAQPLRRTLIKSGAAVAVAGLLTSLQPVACAATLGKPEMEEVKIGFIPLTDCAPIVMAAVLGFDSVTLRSILRDQVGLKDLLDNSSQFVSNHVRAFTGSFRECAIHPGRHRPGFFFAPGRLTLVSWALCLLCMALSCPGAW